MKYNKEKINKQMNKQTKMRKYLNPPILEVVGICPSNITGGGFLVFFDDERTTFRNNHLSLIIMLNKLNWFSEL